jgi:hypothetical protein
VQVVVPYAHLCPETRAALEADDITAYYAYVGADKTAYHSLLEFLWGQGKGFIVVEHDIVVRPGCVAELEACPHDWCGFSYSLSTGYGAYLGFTKFSDALVSGRPAVFRSIAALRPDGTERRYWGRLDTRLKQVLEDREGQTMHVHWPAVVHLNPTANRVRYNCAHCGGEFPPEVTRMSEPWSCPRCGAESGS